MSLATLTAHLGAGRLDPGLRPCDKMDVLRKIIEIDESRCDGCGDCIPSCAEGALAVVDGKVKLVRDLLCDGLGACLGTCEKGALRVVEREAEAFDEVTVRAHLAAPEIHAPAHPRLPLEPREAAPPQAGCPGSRPMDLAQRRGLAVMPAEPAPSLARIALGGSRLSHWPVQLHLVSPGAPYFQGADLLVAADCVPFAYARFHEDFLAGKRLVVGCPKLDDLQAYVAKLTEIFRRGTVRSVTVVKMVVPCCGGIASAVRQAVAASGQPLPCREITVGVEGGVVA